jgi:hypothetical protein
MDFTGQAESTLATEGVKFLFAEAHHLISWWRERRSRKQDAVADEDDRRLVDGIEVSDLVDTDLIDDLERNLTTAEHGLQLPASAGSPPPAGAATPTVAAIARLQELLASALVIDVSRPNPAAARLQAVLSLDVVAGDATGVRIRRTHGPATITSVIEAKEVQETGSVTGISIDEIGG